VTVKTALSPVIPVASLSTSSTVGGCDDIILDPTLTTGQAGRCALNIIAFLPY
jgi:hypothetical protein